MSKFAWVLFLLLGSVAFNTAANAEPQPNLPVLPTIPAKIFTITDFGAIADGKSLSTVAITRAIQACAAAGGGRVVVPAGTFLTGPFSLTSNLDLHLDRRAVILLTDDPSKFETEAGRYQNCISATDCHDICITGSGTIDGQGKRWWAEFSKDKDNPGAMRHRPFMVVLRKCTRVRIQGITLTNSPMFHLVPQECRDVTIDGIHIAAPASAPNTDGLDPSGWNFLITGCVFDVGDDCIAVKATGTAPPGHLSCEDFLITHCTFNHGHGMSIGGQTNGGLRRLTVRDCTFNSTEAGIRLKAGRGAGGLVEDLLYENLTMKHVKSAIVITSFYPLKMPNPGEDPAQPMSATTPIWRHIAISNVTAIGSQSAGQIVGLAESPVQDVVMTRVHLSAEKGMQIVHARGIQFVDSSISAQTGPAIKRSDADVSGLNDESGE